MAQEYLIGVMITPVENPDETFQAEIHEAVKLVGQRLAERVPNLRLKVFEFVGPHLLPARGGYSPLELLQLGVIEKVERKPNFLLVVTEVDISSQLTTYIVALPSRLTNVGLISTKRLSPQFWGEPDDTAGLMSERLAGLMLQTLGYLLNLRPHNDPANIMYRFEKLDELAKMRVLTDAQVRQMGRSLPAEARDRTAKPPAWGFMLRWLTANSGSIWRTARRSNPLRLAGQMTTMIATAFSLMIVIFFSPEMWDVGSTVELWQFVVFAMVATATATLVVYRAYPLRKVATHAHRVSESLVVTNTATLLTLFLTILVLYIAFWLVVYFGIVGFFPHRLMETWPTVDAATRPLDHIKISTFIAGMGVLVGSLGGRVDNRKVMQRILFVEVDF